MAMNYEPNHSRDHADSEYVSCVVVDHNGAEIISNKHTQLYILVQTLIVSSFNRVYIPKYNIKY